MRLSNLFSKEIFLGLAARTRIAIPVSQARTACRNKDLGAKRQWLGREDSNLRMAESKSAALPLGYAPTVRKCADHNRSGRFMQQLPSQFWKRSELSQKNTQLSFFIRFFLPFDPIEGLNPRPASGKRLAPPPCHGYKDGDPSLAERSAVW